MSEGPRLRIGELSRRVGVSPELLRAWESRYALLRPERSAGGLRLFSREDERRVRLMQEGLAAGLSASEAARVAKLRDDPAAAQDSMSRAEIASALERAFEGLDEAAAQAALDRLFRQATLEIALAEVVLPFLSRLGERWATGVTSVADEHFASNVIGGRLRSLARGWGEGVGPLAILACPPGERHELGLLCFGLVLRAHGWRIAYLGADTPMQDIAGVAAELTPTVVVLCAVAPKPFTDAAAEIQALGSQVRTGIGGRGASRALATRLGVELIGGDAVGEAAALTP